MRLFYVGWGMLLLFMGGCQPSAPQYLLDALGQQSPDTLQVQFSTSKGDFVLEAYREWSPLGVDRLYQLVETGYFDSCAIFRVQEGYVAQFGIAGQPDISHFWHKRPIEDETLIQSNLEGFVSYARDGKDSRDAQFFINLGQNTKLDTIEFMGVRGFPPIGKIIKGIETTHYWYAEYGFEPAEHQDEIYDKGNPYLLETYPKLDYIISAKVIKSEE